MNFAHAQGTGELVYGWGDIPVVHGSRESSVDVSGCSEEIGCVLGLVECREGLCASE